LNTFDKAPSELSAFCIDLPALAKDLDELHSRLKSDVGQADLAHVKKLEKWVWSFAILGWSTVWLAPNVATILLLTAASYGRWTFLTHPISHGAYDKIAGVPKRFKSETFARGWRRLIDWHDWIYPEAWHHEHDILHHYNLSEQQDPDLVQRNFSWYRNLKLPAVLSIPLLIVFSAFWKPIYYAPNTLNALINKNEKTDYSFYSSELWSPFRKRFWLVAWHCWLPYITVRFGLLPGLFLGLGFDAWHNALTNLVLAEMVVNMWSFWVIGPNHVGSDLYYFKDHPKDRANYYLHQIVGSVDYHCGGDLRDAMQGWLNYQIEHHLFPKLTLRQYQIAHAEVFEICARHGVPFVRESVFKRMLHLTAIAIGKEDQVLWPGVIEPEKTLTAEGNPYS
jgi:fatty acid desaturase